MVFNPLKHPRPQIADVRCSKIKFEPGDRILVRAHHRLTVDQVKRLRKSIQKWAGCEVEVLIYNGLDMEIEIEKRPTLPRSTD